ncbi:MAG TPA: hypothetical protein VMW73_17710, partial [Spirochaetia bacterium]|nr:hypothetical protein [Spirochaetia bacterium]
LLDTPIGDATFDVVIEAKRLLRAGALACSAAEPADDPARGGAVAAVLRKPAVRAGAPGEQRMIRVVEHTLRIRTKRRN